jgi:hypothetical protein
VFFSLLINVTSFFQAKLFSNTILKVLKQNFQIFLPTTKKKTLSGREGCLSDDNVDDFLRSVSERQQQRQQQNFATF